MDIRSILLFAITVQLLLFSVFLFSRAKRGGKSRFFLAALLFAKALRFLNSFLDRVDIPTPHVYFLLIPFSFLAGPSLFFYVKSLANRKFLLKRIYVLHLIPFVLCSFYFAWRYHFRSSLEKWEILNAYRAEGATAAVVMISVLHLLFLGYFIASFWILARHRQEIKEVYSSLDKISLFWLRPILYGFLLIWVLSFLGFILDLASLSSPLLDSFTLALDFVFANLIVFLGLKQPEVFNGNREALKYQGSKLTPEARERYVQALKPYMERAKPHLEPSLTLAQLARRLSIPPRYLSQVINESLGMSFYDFINAHRVEEAKHLLADSVGRKNILEILLEAGFNSKSVFNRIFKVHTGLTPSEYKQRQVKSAKGERHSQPGGPP